MAVTSARLIASMSYGIHDQGAVEVLRGAGELAEDQRSVEITAGGDELLGDEVHAVGERRDNERVGRAEPRGHLDLVERGSPCR